MHDLPDTTLAACQTHSPVSIMRPTTAAGESRRCPFCAEVIPQRAECLAHKVVFATLDTTTDLAKGLAADGYIITATGCTQATDGSGVILVGTRVQGDTMPRPILVGDVLTGTVDPLLAQGYAIVAVIRKYGDKSGIILFNYFGER